MKTRQGNIRVQNQKTGRVSTQAEGSPNQAESPEIPGRRLKTEQANKYGKPIKAHNQ